MHSSRGISEVRLLETGAMVDILEGSFRLLGGVMAKATVLLCIHTLLRTSFGQINNVLYNPKQSYSYCGGTRHNFKPRLGLLTL